MKKWMIVWFNQNILIQTMSINVLYQCTCNVEKREFMLLENGNKVEKRCVGYKTTKPQVLAKFSSKSYKVKNIQKKAPLRCKTG